VSEKEEKEKEETRRRRGDRRRLFGMGCYVLTEPVCKEGMKRMNPGVVFFLTILPLFNCMFNAKCKIVPNG
jgi:hypothetical protein